MSEAPSTDLQIALEHLIHVTAKSTSVADRETESSIATLRYEYEIWRLRTWIERIRECSLEGSRRLLHDASLTALRGRRPPSGPGITIADVD